MAWNRKDLPMTKIRKLYEGGLSENEVAKKFRTSRSVIRTRLLEMSVKIRGSSEAEKLKWSRMSAAQRIRQTTKAHDACRGRKRDTAELWKAALAHQRTLGKVGVGEDRVFEFLSREFAMVQRQSAWKGYNFDFMVGSIPVELNVGSCDPLLRSTDHKKIKDVLASGRSIVYLVVKDHRHIRLEALKELVRRLKILRRDPAAEGQYWVIRSYRNTYAGFACNFHDRAFIETLKSPEQRTRKFHGRSGH